MHGDLSVIFFAFFKEKIMFKSHFIKSNHRDISKNKVDTYESPVFVADYSNAVLEPKCILTPMSFLWSNVCNKDCYIQ